MVRERDNAVALTVSVEQPLASVAPELVKAVAPKTNGVVDSVMESVPQNELLLGPPQGVREVESTWVVDAVTPVRSPVAGVHATPLDWLYTTRITELALDKTPWGKTRLGDTDTSAWPPCLLAEHAGAAATPATRRRAARRGSMRGANSS
jgi:hypothetical protein